MEVEFLDKFNKDLDKISLKSVKNNLAKLIVSVESAKSINEIHQTKKLKGHKSAYRVRITVLAFLSKEIKLLLRDLSTVKIFTMSFLKV
jgi:mRNA-degrading endonuclease YafQ of YafQ-DinJ toxin-antitoxin module